MNIKLNILTLEITRKCNMKCAHCMRGDAEPVSVSLNTLSALFSQVSFIDQLSITGGEPSLAASEIMKITELAKENDCKIGSFFCATNAKDYIPEFVEAITQLYEYCEYRYRSELTITTDQFHEPAMDESVAEYKKLFFYRSSNERGTIKSTSIISRGNAAKIGLGAFDIPVRDRITDYRVSATEMYIGDRIHLNVHGDLLLDSDLSYKEQEKHKIGNINKHKLIGILYQNFDMGDGEPDNVFYRLRFQSDAGTISEEVLDESVYFQNYNRAITAFFSFRTNLHMFPATDITREVKIFHEEIQPEEKFVKLCNFKYLDTADNFIGNVRMSMERLRLEDRV